MKKNWAESTENSHTPFVPATATASLIWDTPHLRGTFVTIDAPTLTHPYHPESILYIRVHSGCCTSYTFGKMNSIYLISVSCRVVSLLYKSSLPHPFILPSPLTFCNHWSFLLSPYPILWPPDVKSWLIWKDCDAGKDWRQEKGMAEDEMVGWHHQLNGHEFENSPGVGTGQGGLACCSSWGHKESDTTDWVLAVELNWATEQLN